MDFIDLLQQRRSHNHYDANYQISHEEIIQLIKWATLAPTAYHLQNWQFIRLAVKPRPSGRGYKAAIR